MSTALAKYMCIDIKSFYLSAALEYYEYMKMPYALFPQWIIEQYELDKHVQNGYIYLELRRAVWGLPQAGILANKRLKQKIGAVRVPRMQEYARTMVPKNKEHHVHARG